MKKLGTSLLATMGMAWALGLGFGLGGDVGYGIGSYRADMDTPSMKVEFNSSGLVYGGGAKIDLWIIEALGLDLGVRYDIVNASGKIKLNGTEADSTSYLQANILAIPVFLKYGIPMTGMKPYFGLGFSVLKEMSLKSRYGEGEWEKDTLLETDYALLAGGGMNMSLGPIILNPDLRFLYNLTPLRKGDTLPGVDYSASQMQFILGVNFLYSLPLAGE